MQVQLSDIGKKFGRQWLYKGINHLFHAGGNTAVIGNNGSGKSTLLQIIYGWQVPSKGKIAYLLKGNPADPEHIHRITSFVAPYLELPEELTLSELLSFHFRFKKLQPGYSFEDIIAVSGLNGNENKQVRYFSSGMKQRTKLILALYAEHNLLLLDEPCSNLDEQGISWYRDILKNRSHKATTIIASNQKFEYDFCSELLKLSDYSVTAS